MDAVIDEAVKKSKKRARSGDEPEKTKKKRKRNEEKEEEEAILEIEPPDPKLITARSELKLLLLKYPDTNIDRITKIEKELAVKSFEEVQQHIENVRIEIGLKSPTHDSENIVGLVGLFLQKYMGDYTIHQRLLNDELLLAAVEQCRPTLNHYFNTPLQVIHRVAGHISDVKFDQNNFSNVAKK